METLVKSPIVQKETFPWGMMTRRGRKDASGLLRLGHKMSLFLKPNIVPHD
jgi:hypothetical protein